MIDRKIYEKEYMGKIVSDEEIINFLQNENRNLKKENAELSNSVTELTNTKTELENKVTELKAQIESPCFSCQITETLEQSLDELNYQLVNQDTEIRQLKEQNEKMKCCGNCANRGLDKYMSYPCTECRIWHREKLNDKWEFAE